MIRNPVIARVFKELKLIEQWGSGVKRIFEDAAAQGLPEPRIEEIANRLRFVVPLDQRHESVTQSVTQSVTRSGSVRVLLKALLSEPLSSSELREHIGLKHRTNFRNHYLAPALKAGLIEQTLPGIPNSRLQKYRLTPAGQKLLKDERRGMLG